MIVFSTCGKLAFRHQHHEVSGWATYEKQKLCCTTLLAWHLFVHIQVLQRRKFRCVSRVAWPKTVDSPSIALAVTASKLISFFYTLLQHLSSFVFLLNYGMHLSILLSQGILLLYFFFQFRAKSYFWYAAYSLLTMTWDTNPTREVPTPLTQIF